VLAGAAVRVAAVLLVAGKSMTASESLLVSFLTSIANS
jgi:hypothetical protein